MKLRTFLWRGLLALSALLILTAPAAAQIPGQVTEFTIGEPSPDTTATDPYRTSNQFVPITFSHNGSTGSFFINTDGADIEGSTFQGAGGQSGNDAVAAGFTSDGVKTISLVLFQTRINLTARTQRSTRIQYDTTPPDWQINTITLDGSGGQGDTTPSQPYTAGTVYYTSTGSVSLRGTIQDPDNGSPPEECTFSVDGLTTPLQDQVWGADDGSFTGDLTISGPDGDYTLSITAADSFSGANDDNSSRVNRGSPRLVRIVKDSVAPSIEKVEVIRNFNAPEQQILPVGATTFVGRETITLRVTMSEKMAEPPRVSVTQQGGATIQTAILGDQTIDDRVFFYQYSVVAADAQNGPAQLTIEGQYDGPTGNADFGYDLALNPIDQGDPLGTIQNAFVVDTIAPDLIRFQNPQAGDVVSVPADGSKIGKDSFPDTIQVFVEDYDRQGTTTEASGVDFDNGVTTGSQGGTGSTTGLSIQLLAPGGQAVNGTPSIAPPTGVFLTLPDWRNPELGLAGFTDTDGDGVAEPVEGTWTIRVGLVDKVGNTSTETILFTVDNTPINVSDLVVTSQPAPATGNPLNLTGNCYGINQLNGGFPAISVSSTDPTFSATRTTIEFYSLVAGRNSQPEKYDSDPPTQAGTTKTITNIRRPGLAIGTDDWPLPENPAPPAQYVPFGSMDPRVGKYDGLYLVRVTPVDDAGNRGVRLNTGLRAPYQNYEVTIDSITPHVAWTFPPAHEAINEPLRFVDAVVVDPQAPNGNEGCGIDINATEMTLWVARAYQQNNFDTSYIEGQNPQPPGKIRGTLRFIHSPNNTDPTQPSFNPNDDTYRVLLEIVDSNQIVRSLKEDGTMDGIYYMGVNPVDQAGNSLLTAGSIFGTLPPEEGTYYGINPSNSTTINDTRFPFLYDTVEPELTVSNFPEGSYIGGTNFTITGTTRDLSARQDQPTQGGAGILKVEYKLEVVDENGVPLASEAARQPTTAANDPGVWFPAQNNPVIPWTNTSLSPISRHEDNTDGGSNRPTRSTTFPMTEGFGDSQRELRTWTLNGVLPSNQALLKPRQLRTDPPDPNPDPQAKDYYRMTIRSWDRAGNYTDIVRKVTVSLGNLKAPTLQEPPCGSYVNKIVVNFKWATVQGATTYRFRLIYPDGNQLERTISTNETVMTLSREGEYRWQVASMDGAGNLGAFSSLCSLYLDRTPPEVSQFFVTAHSLPPTQQGRLFLGDFSIEIEFNEPLDQNEMVRVTFDPLGAIGAPKQSIVTNTWVNTANESNWSGDGTIPSTAPPVEWDGQMTFQVWGATDRAGNKMRTYYNGNFEIDTGPFFETKFFASLFNENEFTVVFRATEDLTQTPTLSNFKGISWQGNRQALTPMLNSQNLFFATLKLLNTGITDISFDITGEDLDSNTAKRAIEFKVNRPPNSSSSATLQAGALSMTFAKGAVTRAAPVYIFPPASANEELSSATASLGGTSGGAPSSTSESGEILDIKQVADVQAPLLKVASPIELSVKVPSTSPVPAGSPQLGLYGWIGGQWKFLGNEQRDSAVVASTMNFTQYKLAADLVGPKVNMLSHENGDTLEHSRAPIQVTVEDNGSGVNVDSINFTVDGKQMTVEYSPETKTVTWTPDRDITPGEHAVRVTALDLSGNPSNEIVSTLVGPASFGFPKIVLPYPNPATTISRLRYDLTQPAATQVVEVKIYDVSGKRVRTLSTTGPFIAQGNDITWDLTDRRGRLVSNGVYLFRAKARSTTGSTDDYKGKIAVLR